MGAILIVDDEPVLVRQLTRFLEGEGHEVRAAGTGEDGIKAARDEPPDLVLLDLRLPDGSGLEFLRQLQELDPDLLTVLMTGHGSVRDAVEAMRIGASDYLQKPLDLTELALLIERLVSAQRRGRELEHLRGRVAVQPAGILGDDPRIHAIFDQALRLANARLAPGERPAILLTGETGTGKGVVAAAVHEILGGGPFIEVNCTAMPASMVEAELFGHERGSFTDARSSRTGLFEAADGGTIFLDEIGDLEVGVQAKFLKAIEEKRVRRVGSNRDREVDVQVIAATHRDLDEAVREDRFRPDLLHRLRVLTFELPPLRERRGDLLKIARHFSEVLGHQYRGRPVEIAPGAEGMLLAYGWPGNVRELRNVVERAMLLGSGGALAAEDLAALLDLQAASTPHSRDAEKGFELPESGLDLEGLERDLIRQALEMADGNRTRAAGLLGLSRDTLRYRIEKYGLS